MNFKTCFCKTAAALLLAASATAHGTQDRVLPERVEAAARDRVAASTYQTLVFAVVDGGTSSVRVFGKLDGGSLPDGDTVYEIGSITKTFTATLLADAVQSGRFTLDTPVRDLLADFRIPDRAGKQITLGQLGTQHSGLPRMPSNFKPKDPANPYADYGAAKLGEFLSGYELARDPGQSYEYSNLGFGVLGYALASSAHTTYGELVKQKLLKPLNMSMSGTDLTPAMRKHLAAGHDVDGKPAKNWDMDALAGAGALRSTANDMLRYLRANMGVDESPASAAMKYAQAPLLKIDAHSRIGLAWMTTDKGVVWHNGGTGGYRSFIGWSADKQRGVVILSNSAAETDDLGFAALDAEAQLAPTHKAIDLPGEALEEYAGTYQLADKFFLKVFRAGDQLMTRATGQGNVPIYPFGRDEFFVKVVSASITFTRDGQGKVTGLVLHQNGDHPAPKLSAADLPAEPKEIALDVSTLHSYVGMYKFDSGAAFEVTLREKQLEARLAAQSFFPIYASAKDKFFYKVVDAQLDFERDETGKVVAVVLHQNGRDQRAAVLPH